MNTPEKVPAIVHESASLQRKLTILDFEERTSAKSGKKYIVAQCFVTGDGVSKVGELGVFNPDVMPQIAKGEFNAEFVVGVDYERRVSAQLVSLKPYKAFK